MLWKVWERRWCYGGAELIPAADIDKLAKPDPRKRRKDYWLSLRNLPALFWAGNFLTGFGLTLVGFAFGHIATHSLVSGLYTVALPAYLRVRNSCVFGPYGTDNSRTIS